MNLGKTRQINFYNIDSKFYFVDLPGYGYSKMSKVEQEKVGKFIEQYLFTRENISLIILLIDIRHKPGENDLLMYNYVKNAGLPYIIIATKADKIAITKVINSVNELKNNLQIKDNDIVLPFSTERKIYSDDVWNKIEKVLYEL